MIGSVPVLADSWIGAQKRYGNPRMSYLRHLELCNNFDPCQYLRLYFNTTPIGHIHRAVVPVLLASGLLFSLEGERIELRDQGGPQKTSMHLEDAVKLLVKQGALPPFRDEAFAVAAHWGDPILFTLDRAAVPLFGVKAYGVHVNGYRRRGSNYDLWIGRRSATKAVAPNKLDNMIGGGVNADHGVAETLIKEADEEASVPEILARQAVSAGVIAYRMTQEGGGLRDDTLFIHDLELPATFIPVCKDGEIAQFDLLDLEHCLELIRTGDAFKFNVNLVLIDFAIRHGVIGPDHADYLTMQRLLRAGLHN